MDIEGDSAWRAIRGAANADDVELRRELQDAEQELRRVEAELDAKDGSDGAESWRQAEIDPRQIDQWVERATAADQLRATGPEGNVASPDAPVPGTPSARPWRALLAAAAAFLVTPKFLLAATVVAGIAVTGALLQRTTTTLPFGQAVELLLDVEQSEAIREAAGGRVYFDVVESIQVLGEVSGSDASMASLASNAIQQLVAELRQPTAFEYTNFEEPMTSLADQLLASNAGLAMRQQSLDGLVEQVRYGLQAMQVIASRNEPKTLHDNNALHLQQIGRLLGK